jgi:hypothetical protein
MTLPPAFKHSFVPGELVVDDQFDRFRQFLPRVDGEADAAYADRLEKAGLALVITSDQAHDFPTYKRLMAEAAERGIPLAGISRPAPRPPTADDLAARDASKTAALAAAHNRGR